MSTNHALSVFTHSCLSTPRDPRTKLPSSRLDGRPLNWSAPRSSSSSSNHDRPHTTGSIFRHSTRKGLVSQGPNKPSEMSLKSNTQVNGYHSEIHPRLSSSLTLDPSRSTHKVLSQSTRSSHFDPDSLSGNVRPSASDSQKQGKDYGTLFTTLLESNSLLRDEIKKLREEHQRTLTTVQELHRKDCAVQTNGMKNSQSSQSSVASDTGRVRNTALRTNGVDRLSQSLPPQLLENTWVETSSERTEGPLPSSSGSSLSHHSSVYSPDEEELDLQSHESHDDLDSVSTSSLDSVTVEEVDAEQIHLDSISPEVPLPVEQEGDDDLLSSSAESDLSSFTDSSRSEEGSRQSRVSEEDPFASPGMVAVERMWDEFSIDEYAPYAPDRNDSERVKGTKEWTPRITIPTPFSMTIRESNSPKAKSRSMLIAEEERLKKEVLEEAELRKKFHSTPVPATTFLPLYELINAKNEQRREHIKQTSKRVLQSTEKPFSFMKREEEKKRSKDEVLRLSQEFEKAQRQKETMFIAKPVPKHVFDPNVDEKIQEDEEYRRIRIQMRAEELMSKSKLPGSMQVRGREYTIGALRKKRLEENQAKAFLTNEHRFHPTTGNDVPDYDQAYFEFQDQLARRKEAKQTTTAKPFYLRTELIPSRREQVAKDMQTDEAALPENRWPFVGSRTKVPHISPKPSRSGYPAQMTKTAKVRESLTKEKLASLSQKELNEEEERRKKREREKLVRKSVSQKSLSLDPTAWLEEKKRQKLQQVRHLDKERQEKYQQELKEIEERVQSRPLLLEQASLKSAIRSAESKYTAALRKAGLSEDEIQALTSH